MEPFLKWAGGKRWLVSRIEGHLPQFNVYHEPFVGSGALYFALQPKKAILSDTNAELINCYRQIRDHCSEVIRILRSMTISKREYYRVRDKLYGRAQPIRRASYFIYLNKLCWNGLYRVNREGKFNVPVGRLDRINPVFDPEQLLAAQRALRGAKLLCQDFETAVGRTRRGDFVYFDPPYITTHLKNGFIKYNSKLFHQSDALRLAETAHRLATNGAFVMVSNAAHPMVKQQYDGLFQKHEISRASTIAADPTHRTRFPELLVTSFNLPSEGKIKVDSQTSAVRRLNLLASIAATEEISRSEAARS